MTYGAERHVAHDIPFAFTFHAPHPNGKWMLGTTMELIFAHRVGVPTLINPSVMPVLSIILATSLHADRSVPSALASSGFGEEA